MKIILVTITESTQHPISSYLQNYISSFKPLIRVTVWLGLKNSDDQGTYFDLRVDLLKNGVTIATGETRDMRGITRNPSLANLTRGREGAYGRGRVAYLARTISGCKVKDVSKHFQRSPMRMSQAIIPFENELHKDEPLRKTIEKLRQVLIKKGKKKYFISIA